jgi:Fic-DOC domain mobile mystery protein B
VTDGPPPTSPPSGATPLDPDEAGGLIPTYIATRADLNEAEQHNILKARVWATGIAQRRLLTELFVRDLHRRMFDDVWRWAGRYRVSGKTLGINWEQIPEQVKALVDDAAFWIAHQTYGWDELGARFHHRLVAIHPFSTGNGRHARLFTDLLLEANGQARFTWGASQSTRLDTPNAAREQYIRALKAADGRDLLPLVRFVRT